LKCQIVSMDSFRFDGDTFQSPVIQELITGPIEIMPLKLFPKNHSMTLLSKSLRLQGVATCGTWYPSLQHKKG
jgi:hypothetical protein